MPKRANSVTGPMSRGIIPLVRDVDCFQRKSCKAGIYIRRSCVIPEGVNMKRAVVINIIVIAFFAGSVVYLGIELLNTKKELRAATSQTSIITTANEKTQNIKYYSFCPDVPDFGALFGISWDSKDEKIVGKYKRFDILYETKQLEPIIDVMGLYVYIDYRYLLISSGFEDVASSTYEHKEKQIYVSFELTDKYVQIVILLPK